MYLELFGQVITDKDIHNCENPVINRTNYRKKLTQFIKELTASLADYIKNSEYDTKEKFDILYRYIEIISPKTARDIKNHLKENSSFELIKLVENFEDQWVLIIPNDTDIFSCHRALEYLESIGVESPLKQDIV